MRETKPALAGHDCFPAGIAGGKGINQAQNGQNEVQMATTTKVAPTIAEIEAKLAVTAQKKLEAVRANVIKKYPHALPDTLVYDETVSKYKCQIKCTKTGDTSRWVYTSDLWQVTMCEEAAKADRSEREKALRKSKSAAKVAPASPAAPEEKYEKETLEIPAEEGDSDLGGEMVEADAEANPAE